MKRKIFITGHGFDLHTPTNLEFKTRFYIKSGAMLSDNVIPGIIQGLKYPELVDNCDNWSDKNEVYSYEKDEKGNPSDHLLVITEEDPKSVLICGQYKPVDSSKELPVNTDAGEYRLVGTDENRMFRPFSEVVTVAGKKQHLAVHEGRRLNESIDLSNHFLVCPKVETGDLYYKTGYDVNDFIHLSDIIHHFRNKYSADELRFFWLACRSEI